MAFIVEEYTGERGIQIGVEEIIRPFSFGTNWSKIRIGVLWAANGYAQLPAGVVLNLGVCTGNSATLSNNCTDAVWYTFCSPNTTSFYSGTPPNNYYSQGGTFSYGAIQRVGSTSTSLSGAGSHLNGSFSANPSFLRTISMWTITKGTVGAAALTIQDIFMNAAQVVTDYSRSAFLLAMENETGTPANTTLGTGIAANLPLRFTKDWDSMFVGWNRSTPTAVINCMTVVRFA